MADSSSREEPPPLPTTTTASSAQPQQDQQSENTAKKTNMNGSLLLGNGNHHSSPNRDMGQEIGNDSTPDDHATSARAILSTVSLIVAPPVENTTPFLYTAESTEQVTSDITGTSCTTRQHQSPPTPTQKQHHQQQHQQRTSSALPRNDDYRTMTTMEEMKSDDMSRKAEDQDNMNHTILLPSNGSFSAAANHSLMLGVLPHQAQSMHEASLRVEQPDVSKVATATKEAEATTQNASFAVIAEMVEHVGSSAAVPVAASDSVASASAIDQAEEVKKTTSGTQHEVTNADQQGSSNIPILNVKHKKKPSTQGGKALTSAPQSSILSSLICNKKSSVTGEEQHQRGNRGSSISATTAGTFLHAHPTHQAKEQAGARSEVGDEKPQQTLILLPLVSDTAAVVADRTGSSSMRERPHVATSVPAVVIPPTFPPTLSASSAAAAVAAVSSGQEATKTTNSSNKRPRHISSDGGVMSTGDIAHPDGGVVSKKMRVSGGAVNSRGRGSGGGGGSYSTGRWTEAEHQAFLAGLATYGREWKRVALHIPTRTSAQVRSHAQKYFCKLQQQDEQQQQQQLHEHHPQQQHHHSTSTGMEATSSAAYAAASSGGASAGSGVSVNEGGEEQRHYSQQYQSPSLRANVERILAEPETVQAEVDDTLRRLRERYRELQERLRATENSSVTSPASLQDSELIAVQVLHGRLPNSANNSHCSSISGAGVRDPAHEEQENQQNQQLPRRADAGNNGLASRNHEHQDAARGAGSVGSDTATTDASASPAVTTTAAPCGKRQG